MTDRDPGVVAEVTQAAQAAMVERDWDSLRLLLHPYLHWTTADGTRVRGRVKVMELLRTGPPPACRPPSSCVTGRSTAGRSCLKAPQGVERRVRPRCSEIISVCVFPCFAAE